MIVHQPIHVYKHEAATNLHHQREAARDELQVIQRLQLHPLRHLLNDWWLLKTRRRRITKLLL
jgi:hypothetical protein